ncbi:serine/threonine-protein kinase [Paucibacter sp. B2R-40]|uniref:serine/threonine-protein kinase n=1 Tax=Paucibacter sp. B2R-40 TaxID=2893554 RepID=UPI0021E4A23E|nr:serine/threonine-protein kinase [Paucibacter sp. B2R-40]MCV2356313.1 serine/threonine-protein kinase [Paucibacter sp. B2R-40]
MSSVEPLPPAAPTTAPCIPLALWPEVAARFDEAMGLPEGERDAWLAALQGEAAPWVRQMLACHAQVATLAPPAAQLLSEALDAQGQVLSPGLTIAQFRLLAPLGQGGMAAVWSAEQCHGVRRRVALKLPFAGLEPAAVMAQRFELERDLLASLEHEHIARLYEAGVSPEGQPFLAMELIEGRPITEYAAGLTLKARLALFAQVLSAVSFAHGRLVIHRDLKPSNILVTMQGQVKLLDFGIARLLGENEPLAAGLSGQAFTPECVAPEQWSGRPLGVGVDVYALGIVLFELLTGRRPYQLDRAGAAPLAEHFASQLAALQLPLASEAAPAQRAALRGDLEAIVAKAMARDPEARYASVEALAADLQRHLNRVPVLARGASRGLSIWRYVQRHVLALSTATVVVLALAGGLSLALWQAEQARAQARRAEAVKGFLVSVFEASDPRRPGSVAPGQASARQLLDAAAERVEREFADEAVLRIELMGLLTEIYDYLEEDERYARLHQRHLALAEAHFGANHRVPLKARLEDVTVDVYHARYAKAQAALREIDRRLREAELDATELRALWWMEHSEAQRGTPGVLPQRLQSLNRAIALYQAHAPSSFDHAAALALRGDVHTALEQWPQAQQSLEQALALPLPAGASQENLASTHQSLAEVLCELGQPAQAMPHFERARQQALRTYGAEHVSHVRAVSQQALCLHRQGQREQALALFDSLGIAGAKGAEGAATATAAVQAGDAGEANEAWATALLAEGRAAEALVLVQTLLARDPALRAEGDERRWLGLKGEALLQLGQGPQARAALQQALSACEKWDAPDSYRLAQARERWARWLLADGQGAAAAQAFQAAAQLPPGGARGPQVLAAIGLARVAWAEGDAALALSAVEAAQQRWQALPSGLADVRIAAYLWRVQALAFEALGQHSEALSRRQAALASALRTDAPEAPTRQARPALGF